MVYVDNFYDTGVRYRGMKMCHMIADSTEELLEMVDKIGVQRKWIQHPGTCNEHFDICFSKRQKAVKLGAHEIHFKIYAAMIANRAKEHGIPWTHTSMPEALFWVRQWHTMDDAMNSGRIEAHTTIE